METNKSTLARIDSLKVKCEYSLVVIEKTNSQNTYGIVAQGLCENNETCVREIGTDKELALSFIDILNNYNVPYVHFLDVIDDLMNE